MKIVSFDAVLFIVSKEYFKSSKDIEKSQKKNKNAEKTNLFMLDVL